MRIWTIKDYWSAAGNGNAQKTSSHTRKRAEKKLLRLVRGKEITVGNDDYSARTLRLFRPGDVIRPAYGYAAEVISDGYQLLEKVENYQPLPRDANWKDAKWRHLHNFSFDELVRMLEAE